MLKRVGNARAFVFRFYFISLYKNKVQFQAALLDSLLFFLIIRSTVSHALTLYFSIPR